MGRHMQTITAKDVKFGFGRLIDLAHGEPMRIAKNGRPEPLIRMLDFAQKWTAAVDWRSVEETRRELDVCNAFLDPNAAEEEGKRLRMPGRAVA